MRSPTRTLLPAAAAALLLLALSTPSSAGVPDEHASDTGAAAAEHSHGPDGLELDPRGRPTPTVPLLVDEQLTGATTPTDYPSGALNPDGTSAPDMTTEPVLRAVYIYPKEGPNRVAQFAGMFQADARAASTFLGTNNGGVSLRWDEKLVGTTPYLDIVSLRSTSRTRQLGGSNQFNLVTSDVNRLPQDGRTKWVVWLDAPSRYCGQGNLAQDTKRTADNANNGKSVGIVYRPYADDPTTGGFCRGRTLLHEIGHNLGALQKVAPNAFDGAHCNDNKNDVMCYTANSTVETAPAFDTGRDDYWDGAAPLAPLLYWTANLNRFVVPAP